MPVYKSPEDALAALASLKDSDKTPQSIGSRMPMWLFRRLMRAGVQLGLSDLASSIRAMVQLGSERVLSSGWTTLPPGARSAADSDPSPAIDDHAGPDLGGVSTEAIIDELRRRRPDLIIISRADLSLFLNDLAREQAEAAAERLGRHRSES